ncbi:hypothetical protein EVAR_31389_1 [Eumeta japonica]|uniref:Uncharacterized protein n=1 Tax=Eumeta variegata TaxID=151549 RepID=A0A4C1SBP2_EUMVA|nr:hypothetical protein EVAR_31389_1 [Eumeta japonica]
MWRIRCGVAAPSLVSGKQAMPADHAAIAGVFNCRFTSPVISNGTNARKKKKPTSFVPPPAPAPAPAPAAAFWRKPLPHHHHGGSSENEGSSVGSRVNIQQKLQEKKQKQLAELRVIEEEIKQGKLAKTTPAAPDEIYSSLQRQPIPRAKTHADTPAWPKTHTHAYQNYPILTHNCGSYPAYTEIKSFNTDNFQDANENAQNIEVRLCTSQVQRPVQNRLYGQESRTFYENPTNLCTEMSRNQLRTPNYIGISEGRIYEENANNPRNIQNGSPRTYAADVSPAGNSYERPANPPLDKPRNPNFDEHPMKNLDYPYCDNNDQNIYNKYGTEKFEYISALQSALNAVQSLDIRNNYDDVQYDQDSRLGFCYPGPPAKKSEPARKLQRCRTPEILLAPRYLEGCGRPVCCHWGPHYARKKEECCAGAGGGGGGDGGSSGSESGAEPRDTPRPPSDIDSQISLPRSYTLPREFRYWRRRRPPHAPPAHNNSSDGKYEIIGDVDSADEGVGGRGERDEPAAERRVRRLAHRKPAKPETKL